MGPLADSRGGPRHVRDQMSTGETQLAAQEKGNGVPPDGNPLLSLRELGFSEKDLDLRVSSKFFLDNREMTLRELIAQRDGKSASTPQ